MTQSFTYQLALPQHVHAEELAGDHHHALQAHDALRASITDRIAGLRQKALDGAATAAELKQAERSAQEELEVSCASVDLSAERLERAKQAKAAAVRAEGMALTKKIRAQIEKLDVELRDAAQNLATTAAARAGLQSLLKLDMNTGTHGVENHRDGLIDFTPAEPLEGMFQPPVLTLEYAGEHIAMQLDAHGRLNVARAIAALLGKGAKS